MARDHFTGSEERSEELELFLMWTQGECQHDSGISMLTHLPTRTSVSHGCDYLISNSSIWLDIFPTQCPLSNKGSNAGGDYCSPVSPHLFDHLPNCFGIFKYLQLPYLTNVWLRLCHSNVILWSKSRHTTARISHLNVITQIFTKPKSLISFTFSFMF